MAVVMMLIAFGFMSLLRPGASLPVSMAITLVVFALSFVAVAVLLDKTGSGRTASLVGGAAVALGMTLFVVAIISGLFYAAKGMASLETETLLAGFAISLIASVVINQLTIKL